MQRPRRKASPTRLSFFNRMVFVGALHATPSPQGIAWLFSPINRTVFVRALHATPSPQGVTFPIIPFQPNGGVLYGRCMQRPCASGV